MQLWIICGAHSGVGKTYTAKQLCALLPDVAYAKLGHHKRRTNKASNYFTELKELKKFIKQAREEQSHIVVESNALAKDRAKAIRIFLNSTPGENNLRDDAGLLRDKANIIVGDGEVVADWQPILRKQLKDNSLSEAVLGILAEQQRRLSPATISVRSKIWMINQDGDHIFGSGVATLIEDVSHLGSLRAAAESSGMSYRHAWGAIKEAEGNLGVPLLDPSTGGSGGGGSQITKEAKRLLRTYRRLVESVATVADSEFAALMEEGDGHG